MSDARWHPEHNGPAHDFPIIGIGVSPGGHQPPCLRPRSTWMRPRWARSRPNRLAPCDPNPLWSLWAALPSTRKNSGFNADREVWGVVVKRWEFLWNSWLEGITTRQFKGHECKSSRINIICVPLMGRNKKQWPNSWFFSSKRLLSCCWLWWHEFGLPHHVSQPFMQEITVTSRPRACAKVKG